MNLKLDSIFYKALLAAVFAGNAVICFASDAHIPVILEVSANQVVLFESKAEGVQIYECKVRQNDSLKYEWAFKAPEAVLYGANGKMIAHHYAGPTWESNDGSKVVGEVKGKYSVPDAKSIPWLLLSTKSNYGKGVFAQVTSIQRVDTQGGEAPAEACNQSRLGKEARIPYKAVYRFFVLKK